MPPRDDQGATVVVIELGEGQVYVKVAEPKPEPQRVEVLLRRTIDAWFDARPWFVIDRTQPVVNRVRSWASRSGITPRSTGRCRPFPCLLTAPLRSRSRLASPYFGTCRKNASKRSSMRRSRSGTPRLIDTAR